LSGKIDDITRAQIKKLIVDGKVTVNDSPVKASYRLRNEDRVTASFSVLSPPKIKAENIPLDIIYQDSHILVLDKPSGMVIHPGAGNFSHTLVNALLFHFPDIQILGPSERPGIVHRLDKETSGVMVVALTDAVYVELQRQFKAREVDKHYLGLVWGSISNQEGSISWPIGRHVRYRERISVKTNKPREAETRYKVRQVFRQFSLLEISPVTGRMHQIRVHLAAAGHPIVGDSIYGRRKAKTRCPRLFLHADRLAFMHPHTQTRVEFSSSLPQDLRDFLRGISQQNS
jgi:23S rRNA pseudouridine1911/1915/1917 synthase